MTQPSAEFTPGERVRHAYAGLTGVVERFTGDYVKVNWDHHGLAIAALGTMADLQRPSMLEHDEAANSQPRNDA